MTIHRILFQEASLFWSNVRTFAFEHRTVFEIGFMFLYTSEQAILIGLTYFTESLRELNVIISLFSLIVLATFELHKRLMESRIRILESKLDALQHEKDNLQLETKSLQEKYECFIEYTIKMSKALYKKQSKENL